MLESVGIDEKWIYYVHYLEQRGAVKAIGITDLDPGKKMFQFLSLKLTRELGATEMSEPPACVLKLFEDDNEIVANC